MNRKVYLDNACTSIVQPSVLAAADRYTELYKTSTKSASDVTRECRTYLEAASGTSWSRKNNFLSKSHFFGRVEAIYDRDTKRTLRKNAFRK